MQLFTHAVRQLFGNFGAVLKIAGVLLLLELALVAYLGAPKVTFVLGNS